MNTLYVIFLLIVFVLRAKLQCADALYLGSYRGVLVAFLVGNVLATFLITRLGPYRYRANESTENDGVVQLQLGERSSVVAGGGSARPN